MTRVLSLPGDWEEALRSACEVLSRDSVVGLPTETVYGLAGNASSLLAVQAIYALKGRPSDNPLIVHFHGLNTLCEHVYVPDWLDIQAFSDHFWPGPCTALFKRKGDSLEPSCAGLPKVAMRWPADEFFQALLQQTNLMLAAPSANLSGRPSPTEAAHVLRDLSPGLPLLIDGGPCRVGLESTVIDLSVRPIRLLRPGGVNLEALQAYFGEVVLATEVQDGQAESPGQKYRHYAPEALLSLTAPHEFLTLEVLDGDVFMLSNELMAELSHLGLPMINLGSREDLPQIAKTLYGALRQADRLGAKRILCETFPETGAGLAIMNRLRRAAQASSA